MKYWAAEITLEIHSHKWCCSLLWHTCTTDFYRCLSSLILGELVMTKLEQVRKKKNQPFHFIPIDHRTRYQYWLPLMSNAEFQFESQLIFNIKWYQPQWKTLILPYLPSADVWNSWSLIQTTNSNYNGFQDKILILWNSI